MTIHSKLASPRATRAVLEQWGLATKKSLGQHFLVADNIVGKITALANLEQTDSVLEVGPGIGTLTVAMLPLVAGVTAIEKDDSLIPALMQNAAESAGSFALIQGDALDISHEQIEAAAASISVVPPNKLVANLPYAVAATIVLEYFKQLSSLQSATVMVQSEVAARMNAAPGTKAYGAYTVKLQLLAQYSGSFNVSPGNFMPPPRVESTVIRLDRCDQLAPNLLNETFMVAEAAFYQRRKNIRNSMLAYFSTRGINSDTIDEVLRTAGVPAQIRGETLSTTDFISLAEVFVDVVGRQLPFGR